MTCSKHMTAMKKTFVIPLLLAAMAYGTPSMAATNAIASCYDSKLAAPTLAPTKELFVIIDQTTLLDDGLKQSVANQLRPFLTAGNGFSVLVFSAFTQGKYTQLLTSGQLDHPMPAEQRNDVSKPRLTKYDQCMAQQSSLAAQAVGGALRLSFEGTSGDIAKSDVLASLKDISSKVKQSPATEKVVLLVSDMLENSSVSSFYASQTVRRIDPERELKLASDSQLFGHFADARVYVIGAGLLTDDGKKNKAAYRDPKTMLALSSFWKSYFEKSKAQLMEFGQPALLNQIK
jgi:hypothetical protein